MGQRPARCLRRLRLSGCIALATTLFQAGANAGAGADADADLVWAAMPAPLMPLRLPVALTPGWAVRAEAAEFEASDATPVRAISGDWARYHPRNGGNAALQVARLELAASRERWEIAALLRSEVVIHGTRGAFDAVHAYKQRQTLADGSALTADAQASGTLWTALRGARSWAWSPADGQSLQATMAISLLSVSRVQLTAVQGSVGYTDAGGYGFAAQTQQRDSRKQFGGYGIADARGSGYSADFGLLWQPSADSFVNLSLADAISSLRVNGVSTQRTTLSSSTRSLDAHGYLDYTPLVTGSYAAESVSTRLSRKTSLAAGLRLHGGTVGLRWESMGSLGLPGLWAALPLAADCTLQLDADARFHTFGIGLRTAHASLLLRSQALPVGASSALGWQATFTWPW